MRTLVYSKAAGPLNCEYFSKVLFHFISKGGGIVVQFFMLSSASKGSDFGDFFWIYRRRKNVYPGLPLKLIKRLEIFCF